MHMLNCSAYVPYLGSDEERQTDRAKEKQEKQENEDGFGGMHTHIKIQYMHIAIPFIIRMSSSERTDWMGRWSKYNAHSAASKNKRRQICIHVCCYVFSIHD